MYNCFDISNKLMQFAKEEGLSINTMKLLKLTYLAHGYYLGFFDKPLFGNEIQAWKYGPVIPELYHVIKRFGRGSVDETIIELYTENSISKNDQDFLKLVWDNYKEYTGLQLSTKTHEKGSPWDQVYNSTNFNNIENSVITTYYKNLINAKKAA